MDIMEAMRARHSVRQYDNRAVDAAIVQELQAETDLCNQEGGLHIQLVTGEPNAFSGFMAHYGSFRGVTNYIALVGTKGKALEEKCGYYGERLALKAQQLGLNTCWVALTYRKTPGAFQIAAGEKLAAVIAFGYGTNQGVPHKSKAIGDVSNVRGSTPDWFRAGVEAALLAPTAMNQQKFTFTYAKDAVTVTPGVGFYTKMDLGIVKYHFEAATGKKL